MDMEWLTKRVTREELIADKDGPVLWEELLDAYQDGDELWEFCSPADYWENLAGSCGVTLVRNGDIVEYVITMMT